MNTYYIIDFNRFLHLVTALNAGLAKDKFNDTSKSPADLVLTAEKCRHGRFVSSGLRSWMDYKITSGCMLCPTCSK